jgi:transcriptional regulator with XRE-family HTH domain
LIATATCLAVARETLGERIERLRGLTGLSARELGALAGLHASHVRIVEKSTKAQVSAMTLRLIANVFGVTLDWLFDGGGAEPATESLHKAVARAQRLRNRSSTGKAA